MFEKFFHEVTGPYIWGLILLLSLRAIFSSVRKKDYPHAAAFIVVAIAAAFMTASALDMSMLVLMRRKEQTNLFREIAEIFA